MHNYSLPLPLVIFAIIVVPTDDYPKSEVGRLFFGFFNALGQFMPLEAVSLTAPCTRFWDLENLQKNARQIRELKAPPSIPYSARINPDFSRFVIMGDRKGRLVAWDIRRNKIITDIKLHRAPILSVAYQPAGKGAFLSAGGDGQLKIRLPEGERSTVYAHDGPMFQASYSATGRYVYTVGADRTAKIWDTAQLDQQNLILAQLWGVISSTC